MRNRILSTRKVLLLLSFVLVFTGSAISVIGQSTFLTPVPASGSIAAAPCEFTENIGQWPDSILFRASTNEATLWFTADGIYYQFFKRTPKNATGQNPTQLLMKGEEQEIVETDLIKVEFVGANANAKAHGIGLLSHKKNYFHGNVQSKWRIDVPSYEGIEIEDLYPGVDAHFTSRTGVFEYSLQGSKEAVAQVRATYHGLGSSMADDGAVAIETRVGQKLFRGILPEQNIDSRRASLLSAADITSANVSIVYSRYLGGNGEDKGEGIIVDASKCAYVTGTTYSSNFPLVNPADGSQSGRELFVTKYSADGTSIIYSTFMGGDDSDESLGGIAVDASGCAYVTGAIYSTNYPTTVGAYQTEPGDNNYDAAVTKLSSGGNSLVYSTYLGGNNDDVGYDIAVDTASKAYVTGRTKSTDFPTVNAFQSNLGGANAYDVFVAKISANGTSLDYSTYLGGWTNDHGYGIAVDGSGYAFVAGHCSSNDFPLKNAYQSSVLGDDGFVTKLATAGDTLIYSTALHGSGSAWDDIQSIAIDNSGFAYVTGRTNATDFPTVAAYQATYGGGAYDAFVTKLAPSGSSLNYSTYLGGDSLDFGYDIAVDKFGSAFITGYTSSSNYPVLSQYQSDSANVDAFATRLSKSGNTLIYSTYLRGNQEDQGHGIAVGDSGYAYITGWTNSTEFPSGSGVTGQPASIFVTKLWRLCCQGTTGDFNIDGAVDLYDLSFLTTWLTTSPKPALPCIEEANVDGLGWIDLSDVSLIIAYLTVTPRPSLPSCP